MNTHGHETIAENAGLELLEDAFGRNRSLNALYLGNWLTDVSQAVDPVAYASGSKKAQQTVVKLVDALQGLLEEYIGALLMPTLTPLRPDLSPIMEPAKKALAAQITYLFAAPDDERSSNAAKFFRDAFLYIGYFKFVHPEKPGAMPRMDFECFMRVFGRPTDTRGATRSSAAADRPGAYTQYYPHEHIDRPEMLPARDPPVYAPGEQLPGRPYRVPSGQRAATRSPRRPEQLAPDLYAYIRDHMEMTAGLLAEADLEMRDALRAGIRDNDPAWHLTLAKLGHALHQVEDFFAHSNWAELAALRLGPGELARLLPPETGLEWLDRAFTLYQKRLKRHLTQPLPNWEKHDDERWVVTGYFDFRDTLLSLAHVSEELWGGDATDPWADLHGLGQKAKDIVEKPRTTLFEAQKLMSNTLDFVTDPTRALEDRDNEVAKKLKEKYGSDVRRLIQPGVPREIARDVALESSLLKNAPPEIQDAFLNAIIEGGRGYAAGKTAITVYTAVKDISALVRNPLGFVKSWLTDRMQERLKKALVFYVRERVYDWIGASRIGSHSLLAKDHGSEPLYRKAHDCATAVHWYIVHTMLRWKRDENAKHIDWLELLEHFLRNPLPPTAGGSVGAVTVPVTIVHTVRAGEQLGARRNPAYSLEDIYRENSFHPDSFSWRTIADANFGTTGMPTDEAQRTVNAVLRDQAWGYPVQKPNYAFKPGLRVLIPQQKAMLYYVIPPSDDPRWFTEVFEKGWTVFKGYADPEAMMSHAPLEPHSPISISAAQHEEIVSHGRALRLRARGAYMVVH
jgi:hypothetical protein